MTHKLLCAFLLSAAIVAAPVTPATALTVFDPTNYSQNLLTAVRSLEQIQNQIQQLQNEAQMLVNMARNLESLDFAIIHELNDTISAIDGLVQQARGLDFEIASVEQAFAELFPDRYDGSVSSDTLATHARQRWEQVRHALDHSMRVQSQVVQGATATQQRVNGLLARSQGAVGLLQAQQATNQLIALQSTQMIELQQLLAAQARADALELARTAADEERAREQRQRFLGDGSAYTPDHVTVFRD
ncbi:MAG: P-type conjugative transfer protein TrbJ [Roseitalea porphyridii]|jgi:P-type conjugative transfer protein TrbJ|uniref:P-type conjugative transfer protein TrbJ n=1 Tax=Pseudomonadota TaxID=1224 RepID=UPI0032ECD0DF